MESLVSTQWVEAHLGEPDLVLVDASTHMPATQRDAHAEYLAGHIPGARFLSLARLVDTTSKVPQALPRPEQLAQELAQLGIGAGDRIVFYDDSAVKTSARAWFLCRAHGIENIAILNGGLAKWKAEGHPLENGPVQTLPATPMQLEGPARIRYKADMLANIAHPREQVVDARDHGRFSGEIVDTVHNLPGGHIPGARNLPFATLFCADGTYKQAEALRTAIEAAGIMPDRPIVSTCGSGVTACVVLFALHLLGRDDTALYDGSWLDWASDPATPKETAVQP